LTVSGHMFGKLKFENQVNAIGGLVLLVLGGVTMSELLRSKATPACSTRFPASTQMSLLRTNGVPMAPAELQARIGVGERGIIEKASVVKSDGPSPWALNIKVGTPEENEPSVAFTWTPHGMSKASSACLKYSVLLPREFDFSQGGFLPGFVGDFSAKAASTGQTGFASRIGWTETGQVASFINLSDSTLGDGGHRVVAPTGTLPRGRWFDIEQEIQLNAPNTTNGQLRVWVDGKLLFEKTKVAWRGHSGVTVSGVVADIGYKRIHTNILPARKVANVRRSDKAG